MDEEAETKAIEKWLRMVDKPLATKRTRGQKMNEAMPTSRSFLRRLDNEIGDSSKMSNIRKIGLAYLKKLLGNMPSDPVAVSKFFKANESRTRKPVWWFDLPIRKVKNNRQGVYYLMGKARKSGFVVLKVPNEFLMRNLRKFDTQYRDNIRLHIAAEGANRFVDERVKSGMDFSRFELKHPKDTRN